MIPSWRRHGMLFPLLATWFAACLPAQCGTEWVTGSPLRGTDKWVRATAIWDPDGAGPATPVVALGGPFLGAGPVGAFGIATFDPATRSWSSLGRGMSGGGFTQVLALAVLASGDLVAGGDFLAADGVPASNVARWDGTTWHPLGAGLDGRVFALEPLPNGGLLVGGDFARAGGVASPGIARWDGAAWHALGAGLNGAAYALKRLPNGDVIAGGYFQSAGGVPANSIARWNGATWQAMGSGMLGQGAALGITRTLAELPTGDLVAGGWFVTAGGINAGGLARWDGTSWYAVGQGTNGSVHAATVDSSGELIVGGDFTAPSNCVARWDGLAWHALGSGIGSNFVYSLCSLPNGRILVAGDFLAAGGTPALNVATWNGTSWTSLGGGTNAHVTAITRLASGGILAGGFFETIGNIDASHVASWDGVAWAPLGAGTDGPVNAVAEMPNGDLVVAGEFTSAGGVNARNVARWDGRSWHALGSGIGNTGGFSLVYCLLAGSAGELYAGGRFQDAGGITAHNIAVWNGASWSAVGSGLGGQTATVASLARLANGDVAAGGTFPNAGSTPVNNIARWDGLAWHPFAAGVSGSVNCMLPLASGELVVGGGFWTAGGTSARSIARWDGSTWSALGSLGGAYVDIYSLCTLPDGDLVAVGDFGALGGTTAKNIARWDGNSWSACQWGTFGPVFDIEFLDDGAAVAGGLFTIAGPPNDASAIAAGGLAFLRAQCPAAVAVNGPGCSGTAGPLELIARGRPWVGGSFGSDASGMATNALAASLLGASGPGTPLSQYVPFSATGCLLLASPDAVSLLSVGGGGSTSCSFALPNNATLSGLNLYHQVIQLEIGPTPNLSASNGLRLVIGSF
ncbi:MAG: hypothetical protein KDE27_29795 [Planctomycetes bacterium]|nr:hypothetical protein [Planctomycetota bacterium]